MFENLYKKWKDKPNGCKPRTIYKIIIDNYVNNESAIAMLSGFPTSTRLSPE